MLFRDTGLVKNGLHVMGIAWSPVYLLSGKDRPVLFEAGFHCMGRLYEEAIRAAHSAQTPDFLFLSHVHWDHCGATAHLKKAFPGLRVGASRRAHEIIERPNAQALMKELSRNVIPLVSPIPGVDGSKLIADPFEPFDIDIVMEDGLVIDLKNGLTVHVLATPGHTRDLISYYIPERKILFATEAAGLYDQTGQIITEFLVDYDMYLASLRRLAALDVDILCPGHHFVLEGDDVKRFFPLSIAAAQEFRHNVETLLKSEGGSVDRVVQLIKAQQYDTNKGIKQAEGAYLLNLTTRVTHLAEKLRNG